MANYQFLIKEMVEIEASNEDEAYDIVYADYPQDGWNFTATLYRTV